MNCRARLAHVQDDHGGEAEEDRRGERQHRPPRAQVERPVEEVAKAVDHSPPPPSVPGGWA
jgi:hypothetical protein